MGCVLLIGYCTWNRDRLANVAPAREVPLVREALALDWLHRLNRTVASVEEDAFPVFFFDEGKAVSGRTESRILLDEIELADAEKIGDCRDLGIPDLYLAGPAAAVRAALALVIHVGAGH